MAALQAATKCPFSSSNVELQRTGSAGAAWLDIQPENRVLACQVITYITSRHVTSRHVILHSITSPHSLLCT